MRGYTNLTTTEIECLCHILNSTKFMGFEFSDELTPINLQALSTDTARALITTLRNMTQDETSECVEEAKSFIDSILEKSL